MAQLLFKGIAYGAEKIPDKVFDSIPGGYFKTKEAREQRAKDRARRRRDTAPAENDDYYNDYYTSGDEDRYRSSGRSRRRERQKRSQSMGYADDRRNGDDRYDGRYDDRYADRYSRNWDRERNDPFEQANSAPTNANEYVPRAYNPADPYAPKPYNPSEYAPNGATAAAMGAGVGAGAATAATAAHHDAYYPPSGVPNQQQVSSFSSMRHWTTWIVHTRCL
jgi:hypothetical protein